MQWNVLFTSHTTLQMCKIIPLITNSDGYVFASAYLWGIVVSVWSTHRPRGGDGTGLTVSIRRPESRLLQSAGQRTHKHFSLTKSGWDNNRCANSEYTDRAAPNWTWGKPLSTVLSECINLSLKQQAVVLHWRTNKLYYYHCGRQRNAPQAGTSRRLSTCFLLTSCKCALAEMIVECVCLLGVLALGLHTLTCAQVSCGWCTRLSGSPGRYTPCVGCT